MKNIKLISLFIFYCSNQITFAAAPTAEPAREAGDISGSVVICPQLNINRVNVHTPGHSHAAWTADDGSFTLTYVPPGTYNLVFENNNQLLSSLSNVNVIAKQQTDVGLINVCVDADEDGYDATHDCDDTNASIYPNAPEICNGVDDNCNGTIDDGFSQSSFYQDADNDTFGNLINELLACVQPQGYVSNSQDCYDSNAEANPNQTSFFGNHRGDSSFDYNCDGQQERQNNSIGACSFNGGGCDITPGWQGGIPLCGALGSYITSCSYSFPSSCTAQTIAMQQTCR